MSISSKLADLFNGRSLVGLPCDIYSYTQAVEHFMYFCHAPEDVVVSFTGEGAVQVYIIVSFSNDPVVITFHGKKALYCSDITYFDEMD